MVIPPVPGNDEDVLSRGKPSRDAGGSDDGRQEEWKPERMVVSSGDGEGVLSRRKPVGLGRDDRGRQGRGMDLGEMVTGSDVPDAGNKGPPRRRPVDEVDRVQTRRQLKRMEKRTEWSGSNWLQSQGMDLTRVREAQASDPALAAVRSWLQQGERPGFSEISQEGREVKFYWGQYRSIEDLEGVLIRRLTSANLPERRQVLMPGCLRDEALRLSHDVVTAGHLGIRKTLANCRRRFLWQGMALDVELHVKACDVCGKFKTHGKKRRAPMMSHVVGLPMERVCIDIVGPFPETDRGHKYALVVTDWFTKYVEIYPMKNQEAVTVAEVMTKEFFSRYGVPLFLHSDQGTQFESRLFQRMCEMLGIKKTRTTPFHPQSDGISERNIKTLSKMIAMTAREQTEWDDHLPFLSMAYRATVHESTGLSPNLMMYGRDVSMPVDVMIGLPKDHEESPLEYVQKLREQLESAYRIARDGLKKSAERQKRLYDNKVHGEGYSPGDLCWMANKVRKKGVSPKLQPAWKGPCLLVKMHGDVTAEVRSSPLKTYVVHVDLLKPCFSTKVSGWLEKERRRLVADK